MVQDSVVALTMRHYLSSSTAVRFLGQTQQSFNTNDTNISRVIPPPPAGGTLDYKEVDQEREDLFRIASSFFDELDVTPTAEFWKGGQAYVYKVLDEKTQEIRVLKIAQNQPHSIAAFEREADMLDVVGQAGGYVPAFYANGVIYGRPYILMESVEPHPRGPMFIGDAIDTGLDLAYTVERAHQMCIEHRDITNSNIGIQGSSGRTVLFDFGIGKWDDDRVMSSCTPCYAMPDHLIGLRDKKVAESLPAVYEGKYKHVFGAVDQACIAAVVYMSLTSILPFSTAAMSSTAGASLRKKAEHSRNAAYQRHLFSVAAALDHVEAVIAGAYLPIPDNQYVRRPTVAHGALSDVLRKALHADPKDRYNSVADFRRKLLDVKRCHL
jgi:serine/threonine protein kinase